MCRVVAQFTYKQFVNVQDNAAHVYRLDVNNLTETSTLTLSGTATDVKYSPDGRYLAAGDTNRKVALFAFPGYQVSSINLCLVLFASFFLFNV